MDPAYELQTLSEPLPAFRTLLVTKKRVRHRARLPREQSVIRCSSMIANPVRSCACHSGNAEPKITQIVAGGFVADSPAESAKRNKMSP
jgi:hypothetical protein